MAGADFPMPGRVHRCTCRVLYGDTDSGGVVYYANYLRYFEQGRTELMREHICSYRELEEQGLILPVVECQCRYKISARYDDLLLIETAVAEVKAFSCRFHYRILRETDGKLLAAGATVNAAVDRSGKLIRLPTDLLEKLRAFGLPGETGP
ncbi:MAG: thioesterase family protein [Desulfobacteraceae bacterium]|nr:thioesterase family protein [Desulfobacteraceae bacterium]